MFFDSRGAGAQILSERVTNNFIGGGMHGTVDITKPLPRWPALALYCRLEASGLIGNLSQSFAQTQLVPGVGTASGSARIQSLSVGVPVIDVYAGMSYVPRFFNDALRMTGGYRMQQWWYLGQTSSSEAGLFLQGFFVRGEFGY